MFSSSLGRATQGCPTVERHLSSLTRAIQSITISAPTQRSTSHRTSLQYQPFSTFSTTKLSTIRSLLNDSLSQNRVGLGESLGKASKNGSKRFNLVNPTKRFYNTQPPGGYGGDQWGQRPGQPRARGNGGALDAYCIDLTQLARDNKLDPVIGREEVLRRTIEVLSRRRKNNPILIGDPGVGKTAIIEGLAQRIVLGEVPESVRDHRVLSLDFGALMAGAGVKGEFEQRMKAVIREVEEAGNIILFVDEVHLLTGGGGGDSVNAANLLKPALARGTLLFCGATTLDEYRMYIEKDGALARRFQTVYVEEPSVEDTVSILRGIKDKYELHHRVMITDAAVVAAAQYAKRYFRDRKLPDKAIDLLDEAASRLCLQLESKPDPIYNLERDLMQRHIELAALEKETDEMAIARRKSIKTSVEKDEKKLERLSRIWESEKARRQQYNEMKESYEAARVELQNALRSGDYTKAGELQHVKIPSLEHSLAELKKTMQHQRSLFAEKEKEKAKLKEIEKEQEMELSDTDNDLSDMSSSSWGTKTGANRKSASPSPSSSSSSSSTAKSNVIDVDIENNEIPESVEPTDEELSETFRSVLLTESVGEEDIANVVARHTGIPVSKLLEKDKRKLLRMEKILNKRVIGQEEAISSIAECVRVARAGLQATTRPHGVFLFLGPSGVGKTELSKALADFLFDDPNAMVRIDMSEYHEKFSSSRLIGSPPGYVGYEEGGVLTEAVRRRPYQIVLFDEIEKAHKDVTNLLLQVFDEGFLTDSQGHKVDFRNTIIIMTSNLGARQAQETVLGDKLYPPSGAATGAATGAGTSSPPAALRPEEIHEMEGIMRNAVRQHFAPEFINRIDEVITFAPLSPAAMLPIAKIQLRDIEKMLQEKRIRMTYSPKALQWLARKGFDPLLGARPMKRMVNTFVLQPLSRALLAGDIKPNVIVKVYAPDELKTHRLPNGDVEFITPPEERYIGSHHIHQVSQSLAFTVKAPKLLSPPKEEEK